ncbi:MAG: hypothetical protein AB1480_12255 [Nitrospirota bacterium]
MVKRESSKTTGISEITGKVVRVRHATEYDMYFIEDMLRKHNVDTTGLDYNQFVIAFEDSTPIGLGRLKEIDGICEIGCVIVVEERKKTGLDDVIVKHLIEFAPVKMVYAMTDKVEYFKRMGFKEVKEGSEKIIKKLGIACKPGRRKSILMYLRKA